MLARQALREHGLLAVGYYILLQFTLSVAVTFWPEFRDNLPAIAKIIPKIIPIESITNKIVMIGEYGYWAYFCMQQFFKGVNLYGLAAAAILGTGIVAREADNRTAEFLLSRPVSRTRILLVRWMVGAGILTVPIFLSTFGGIFTGHLIEGVHEPIHLGGAALACTYASLFVLMLFSLTCWLSSLFEHQLRAAMVVIAFGLLQFSLYIVKTIGDYSLFRLVDMKTYLALEQGEIPWVNTGAFVGLTVLFLALAVHRFARRDF